MIGKRISLVILALLFVVAGALHFTHTASYVKMMPPYLPHHLILVQISGVCEILGGIAVLIPARRRLAGYGLLALLVAAFPANLHMAFNHEQFPQIHPALLWLRLPLQLLLMKWVWWSTHS